MSGTVILLKSGFSGVTLVDFLCSQSGRVYGAGVSSPKMKKGMFVIKMATQESM